jgi:hypothetical protein
MRNHFYIDSNTLKYDTAKLHGKICKHPHRNLKGHRDGRK